MVLMTPIFPFVLPPRVLNSKACQKLVEKPNPKQERLVPSNPISNTVLRPALRESATRPHAMAVRNCAAVKEACRMPAWLDIRASGDSGLNHFSW